MKEFFSIWGKKMYFNIFNQTDSTGTLDNELVFVKYFEDENSYWYICVKYYYNYRKNVILDKTLSYENSQQHILEWK